MKAFFLLVLLIWECIGWNKPKTLVTVPENHGGTDIFTDPTTGVSHILYLTPTSKTPYLYYLQVDQERQIIHNDTIKHPDLVYISRARITALADSAHLFLMITATTKKGGFLFGADSADGGKTWTELKPITDPNAKDAAYSHDILYVKETERLFVFYQRKYSLGMVTRARTSKIFSNERIIFHNSQYRPKGFSLRISYTLQGKKKVIHLMWINNDVRSYDDYEVFYMNSTNNFVTSSKPIRLNYEYYAGSEAVGLAANGELSNTVVVVYALEGYPHSPLHMQFSRHDGDRWSKPRNFTETQENSPPGYFQTIWMPICGTKKHPKLVSFVQTSKNEIEYSHWTLSNMHHKKHKHPFRNIPKANGVLMTCIVNPKDREHLLITAVVPIEDPDREKVAFSMAQHAIKITH